MSVHFWNKVRLKLKTRDLSSSRNGPNDWKGVQMSSRLSLIVMDVSIILMIVNVNVI